MDLSKAIGDYIRCRDHIKVLNDELKQKSEPVKKTMEKIESFLMKQCDELGLDSLKASSGTAYKKSKDAVRISDWESFMDFAASQMADELDYEYPEAIKHSSIWSFFTKAISKETVKEFMEEHEGRLPDGVKYEKWLAITVNKPKTTTIKEEVS